MNQQQAPKPNTFMEYIHSLETPMARVYQQIHKDAFADHDASKAIKFIENWKKENPELLKEVRAFIDQAFEDYAEMQK